MPHVDSHTSGTIGWVDLVTTDLEAVTPFYLGLFGWEPYDTPMPDGQGTYGSSAWTSSAAGCWGGSCGLRRRSGAASPARSTTTPSRPSPPPA